ncbi:MAG TPA: hypothetical protein VKP02_11430, partial [Gemmatimonadaceae bacterium]|nr:hypothetical protein [Gemmatimonadaceae bacterium]
PAAMMPTRSVLATFAGGNDRTRNTVCRVYARQQPAGGSLSVFASAMVLSGLSQLQYGVNLMFVDSWTCATVGACAHSVDAPTHRSPAPSAA